MAQLTGASSPSAETVIADCVANWVGPPQRCAQDDDVKLDPRDTTTGSALRVSLGNRPVSLAIVAHRENVFIVLGRRRRRHSRSTCLKIRRLRLKD